MHQIIAKTREDYNRIASLYAKTRNAARELEQFSDLIQKGQKILDWGCGNGRLVHLLKNRGVEYYGTDQSMEMIKVAKEEFASEVKEGWVHFECSENAEPEFSENFFDLVFAIASVHHLPDPESRLEFFKKVFYELKKDGLFVLTNWNLESAWAQENLKRIGKK
jgi:2-polyprenyl-3-methyl-5-hydroxy-6-metoxy-1,4-benzoquinol methylase